MPDLLTTINSFLSRAPYPKDSPSEPAQISRRKVLLIIYDPVMDPATGVKLSQKMNWKNPTDLVTGFMADILEVSKGLVRYEIVKRIDVNEFPAKLDGFRYTPQSFIDVMTGASAPHMPQEVDYNAIINKFNILQQVARNEIDEVWIFNFPNAGFYESIMGGPGAFWCNAPPLANTSASKRRFVIMGFSFERGVGETLACGSGACAAVVAGRVSGVLEPSVRVGLAGGELSIHWAGEGESVTMTGSATTVFEGQLEWQTIS